MKRVVYISMLGEPSHYNTDNFKSLCSSGLEKDWVKDWLQPLAGKYNLRIESIDICRGETLPDIDSVDAVIIGGSNHDIRNHYSWLDELTNWLKDYRKRHRPLLGICGGHQLVSTVFEGGVLTESESGLMAGAFTIELNELGRQHPFFKGISDNPRFLFANYLHMTFPSAPHGRVLASVNNSPAIVVDHGDNWLSCQFHPESREQAWRCFYKDNPKVNTDAYSGDHDGEKLIENFFAIAQAALESNQAQASTG